ncbi:pyridoxamine 5'-phosphate oxidase family protein [Tuanshanicoccus lijuaniae]|uniref:pyridoxamine 5'-phosphate oxidase family protein n=1 Tax=Aerococcaceae bacterium zg-1292 TaxID=2774330 RepID=UPI0019368CB0|nr:pyridoxamine 5'-phosphate oxidase family protein [Aerococcaceae bacterium zg-1292]MBF6978261.1 pyridoxamine 5'-phosphate oxidase family protein [Aerococcaceae bacterium zg-BR22]MBS4456476.1 pyridoxamine 5'-phosphate oxidase family protein [Aerococcaceae bacterium zg-A91]MBS4458326.1 pyridoxamine 5'-phosphate oxidase family protein [Aerococcaceae bacterium zg-BR33]QQA37445.1 pyridoxamine 5'-phosphate oxidase family protein [Aerococcaceae bacterium zg-1292]
MREMRRSDRLITDVEEIKTILDSVKFLHCGLFDEEYPYVVPLHYGYEYDDENDKWTFYMHGAPEGKKVDLIKQNGKVCLQIDTDVIPVDGGEVACMHGALFKSVMAFGHARLLETPEEKIAALQVLMTHQVGREFPFNEKMVGYVAVIKVEVDTLTAKAKLTP